MKTFALKPLISIQKNAKVLDVGSGNNSLDCATDLLELMPDSNAERGGDFEAVAGKKLHIGSIEAMPFSNQSFRYVHAAHVVEHTQHPDRALNECVRVGEAGYIETPAAVVEASIGWSFHHWYVWAFPDQKKLFLKPKQETQPHAATHCRCESAKRFKIMIEQTPFTTIEPHLPYSCKMTQLNWVKSLDFEVWQPHQEGKTEHNTQYSCNCMYSAFFAHLKNDLLRPKNLRRAWKLRKLFRFAF